MGFEEAAFQGVSFGDAKIQMATALSSDTPTQDAGNPGTPAPGTNPGQPAASPTATADQKAGTSDKPDTKIDQGAKSEGDKDKPLPFDQDPKWKKARAAEKALQDLLEEHGILDVEELKAKLGESVELKKLLGKRDPKKVVDDAEYADRVRKNWEQQKREAQLKDETPDITITRLEQENAKLKEEYESYKASREDQEHAQQVIKGFNTEVDRVIQAAEVQLPEPELNILKLVLGVDNPSNSIDIEDTVAVRKMAKDGISKFQATIKAIKQAAIDEYVAGKSKLAVDTTTQGAPTSPSQGVTHQPLSKDATPDSAFAQAKKEFAEILFEGLKGAQ